jgi:polysaccharide chain length determinant protein (PEP-CTERM system associated)
MEDTQAHALDYVSVFRRRKWWLAGPVLASIVIGVLLVRFLPKQYKSSATLGVAAPIVSPALVNQATLLDNQERLRALSQQLLSPGILERVVNEERLTTGQSRAEQVARLRRAIDVTVPEPVATTTEPRRLDTFIVSYSDAEPLRAQRIANRLATVFVDENSKLRAEHAEDTSAFIATELRASESRLADLESRLRAAKESHMGRLPEQTQANLQTLSGLRQQFESNATALRGEQDRLSMLERQLEGIRQGRSDVWVPTGRGDTAALAPETRVMALERELAVARATYTDKHPEVVRLQEELESAKKEATIDRSRPNPDRLAQLQLDPAFRQLNADREMTRLRIRELERSSGDIQRQIGTYQARVEAAPRVEQQLVAVQRDYDLEKQQYGELSAKLHASTLTENVERNRRGEQFTVLYAATLPTEPTKPIPWRVMVMSVLAGIVAGAALTLGREYLDRTVHDIRELKEAFDVPILAEIAHIDAA